MNLRAGRKCRPQPFLISTTCLWTGASCGIRAGSIVRSEAEVARGIRRRTAAATLGPGVRGVARVDARSADRGPSRETRAFAPKTRVATRCRSSVRARVGLVEDFDNLLARLG